MTRATGADVVVGCLSDDHARAHRAGAHDVTSDFRALRRSTRFRSPHAGAPLHVAIGTLFVGTIAGKKKTYRTAHEERAKRTDGENTFTACTRQRRLKSARRRMDRHGRAGPVCVCACACVSCACPRVCVCVGARECVRVRAMRSGRVSTSGRERGRQMSRRAANQSDRSARSGGGYGARTRRTVPPYHWPSAMDARPDVSRARPAPYGRQRARTITGRPTGPPLRCGRPVRGLAAARA